MENVIYTFGDGVNISKTSDGLFSWNMKSEEDDDEIEVTYLFGEKEARAIADAIYTELGLG